MKISKVSNKNFSVIFNKFKCVRRGGLSMCKSTSVISKDQQKGGSREVALNHSVDIFTGGLKEKCNRKRLFENTPAKELEAKLERSDHTDELASFQKLAAMQNRKWKKRKGPRVRNLANSLSKNRIYACSVCSNVLLSLSLLGLDAALTDLVLFGTTATPAAKHRHSSNLATASCG